MTTTSPTTRLEAVNTMLAAINEDPVSSLTDGPVDVVMAEDFLDRTSRRIQTKGWHFNSVDDYETSLDVDGYVNVPSNTLSAVRGRTEQSLDIVLRGTRMFDRENNTFVFTRPPKLNIVTMLEYTLLPQAARDYIAYEAAQSFQMFVLASEVRNAWLDERSAEAKAMLDHEEAQSAKHNVLTGNHSTASMLRRRF